MTKRSKKQRNATETEPTASYNISWLLSQIFTSEGIVATDRVNLSEAATPSPAQAAQDATLSLARQNRER